MLTAEKPVGAKHNNAFIQQLRQGQLNCSGRCLLACQFSNQRRWAKRILVDFPKDGVLDLRRHYHLETLLQLIYFTR